MTSRRNNFKWIAVGVAIGLSLPLGASLMIDLFNSPASAAGEKALEDVTGQQYQRAYFPNTEQLAANEMRITALGTGMPNVAAGAARGELPGRVG